MVVGYTGKCNRESLLLEDSIMAADFGFYSYTSDKGEVYKIKMAVSSAALQDPANPAQARTVDESVSVGANRRTIGLHARGLRLGRQVGTAPNTFTRTTFLPICSPVTWTGTALGSAVTVGGLAYTVLAKVPERAV